MSMKSSEEDLLISRIVDRAATPEDWERLEGEATRDPDLWRRVAGALHQDALLRDAVAGRASETLVRLPVPTRRRLGFPVAVAAALLLSFFLGFFLSDEDPAPPTMSGGPKEVAPLPAEDAGDDTHPLPPIIVARQPTPDGEAVELWVLERNLQKRTVSHAYELGTDEHGHFTAMKVDPWRLQPTGSF